MTFMLDKIFGHVIPETTSQPMVYRLMSKPDEEPGYAPVPVIKKKRKRMVRLIQDHLRRNRRRGTREDTEKMKILRKQGYTLSQIAVLCGYSAKSVQVISNKIDDRVRVIR